MILVSSVMISRWNESTYGSLLATEVSPVYIVYVLESDVVSQVSELIS